MEDPTRKSDFKIAYDAGKGAVLRMPRWKLYLPVVLGIAAANVVNRWLIIKYSLPRNGAFLITIAAALVFGLLCWVAMNFGLRRNIR
jgi:hypothetical protein